MGLIAATGLAGRPDMGANHAAAKAAMAAFTLVVAQEMFPFGVTVNGVSPAAMRTRMADHVGAKLPEPESGFDRADPENVAPLIAYLASDEASWITGQVFRLVGETLGWYQPWAVAATLKGQGRFEAGDLDVAMRRLLGLYPGSVIVR